MNSITVSMSILFLLGTWFPGGSASAQSVQGAITGVVKDSSGAIIPGAVVTVTNEDTGIVVHAVSQANGVYTAPQLLPGDYQIVAEVPGFKKLEIKKLKVNVGSTLTQDLALDVGVLTETVQVTAQTSMVQTTSGQVGTTVQMAQIVEMPLLDRNVMNLVNLVPGATAVGNRLSIGGGRTTSASANVDGIGVSRGGVGETNVELSPPVEAMQEFKVETNSLSAEFGRASGGVVNAVTKSGTNEWHGSVYEFLRNDRLDAKGWGNDRKAPLRRNNFGGTIGGPVIKNRTFVFYNYDALRQRSGGSTTRSVGLPEWRRGDFSRATRDAGGQAALVPIHDPETGTGTFADPRGTSPFPGNIIPESRLDPVMLKALAYMPAPNRAPNNSFNQSGNWQLNNSNPNTLDYHILRMDHELTDKTRVYYRHLLTQPQTSIISPAPGFGPSDPDAQIRHDRKQNGALNVTHLFSGTFFVNITMGFNRIFERGTAGDCCETNYGRALGIANIPGETFPGFAFGGGLVPVDRIGGFANNGSALRIFSFTNTEWIADFSKVRGNHTLKFGGTYKRYNGNDFHYDSPSGIFTFDGRFTKGVQANGTAISNTGIIFADALLGRMSQVTLQVTPPLGRRIQYYAGYFQDDWRTTRKLTLNLGLRYETETPTHDVTGRMSSFDPMMPNPLAGTGDIPSGALGAMIFANRNGEGKYLWRWDKNNFSPRFGFAYRVFGTNDTVIRGGFGVLYGNPYDTPTISYGYNGFSQNYTVRHPVPFRLRDGIAKGPLDSVPESELTNAFGSRGTRFEFSSASFIDRNRATQYALNYNLTIQHQFGGLLFELGYLANLSRHVPFANMNMNQIRPELLAQTTIPSRLRRPFTTLGSDVAQVTSFASAVGISNYHGITFKSERRFQNGYGWMLAYTFNRWIDNVIFNGVPLGVFGDNDSLQNIYNRKAERANSTNSVPHRLVVSPMVDLPFGQGRKWMNRGGLLNALLGGWQLSTLGTMRSGSHFGATVLNGPRDILGDDAAGKSLRPDLTGGLDLNMPSELKGKPMAGVRGMQWMNPAAFAVPARYTFGNAARTLPGILGPGVASFNGLVGKNFRVGERWRAQFRWEMSNMFNTPEWGMPNDVLGAASFGMVTSAGGRRNMQLGLKLYW